MTQWVPPPWPRLRVGERADEGHLVGDAGHLREDAAELDAGHVGLHGADDAAELGRGGHLGVEGFDVRGAAAEPEPDDRGVARRLAVCGRRGAGAEQVGQHQAAQAERADLEEVAARGAVAVGLADGSTRAETCVPP